LRALPGTLENSGQRWLPGFFVGFAAR
jgi:hypothetical protein